MVPNTAFAFNALSADLKSLVIEQINRPSDLKNVCLVSKQLHGIAVRSLYHTVSLDLGGPLDSRLSAFLSPKNKGLNHVRKIRLYLAQVLDRCNQLQQAQVVTKMILEFLPEDVLEEFSWCPWSPFSAENLLLLYQKQKRMRWLEAMTLDRPNILPELEAKPTEYDALFKSCRRLAFYPESRETLDLCHSFLIRTPAVEEIILHTNFEFRKPVMSLRELNDSATGPGLVTSKIFGHMLPFDKCTPLANLRALRLHKVNLRHCAETYCRIVDFSRIEVLRIFQCPGADSLLSELCKSTRLPQKLEVLEFQHKDNDENDALNALDGLLCLVSGLRDLVVDMENVKTVPAAAGVCRHGKTLEMLNVHAFVKESEPDQDGEELVWTPEDFEKICQSTQNLEQMSCAFPPTKILSYASEEWLAFAIAVTRLPSMVTLNITSWPSTRTSSGLLLRPVYEHLLQFLAQKVFEMATGAIQIPPAHTQPLPVVAVNIGIPQSSTFNLSSLGQAASNVRIMPGVSTIESRLRLVAFGSSDRIFERLDSTTQTIFYRSKQTTPDGKDVVHAVPIGWCARQYAEPRSDVLDFSLSRTAPMPSREWDPGDDSD